MPDYGDNYFIMYYVMIVHHECFRAILHSEIYLCGPEK